MDAVVWAWVESLLLNREYTLKGLHKEQAAREEANKLLRDRVDVIDELLVDNRAQLERALDLFLSGDFPKEILTERKERLQQTIDALEQERGELQTHLRAQTLDDEQIEAIMQFTAEIGEGMGKAKVDFEKRCRLIEELDVRVRLVLEDGQKVVHIQCLAGRDDLSLVLTKP